MLASCLVFLLLVVTACGQTGAATTGNGAATNATNGTQGSGNKASDNTAEASSNNDAPIKVTWWHSMGGSGGAAIEQLAADFNASQSDIQVEAVFQGSYDESLNKLKASMDTSSGPTLVQVYEIGSRFMIDTGAIQPMQKFIDEDQFDVSQFEENILGYYTFDGQLYSMPFNSSNPILYYNKDMFREAGLDPDNPPTTFEEVTEAAEALTGGGQYGASFQVYGWFMEQFFANQGAEYVNNGNGRDALATESLVNSEAGLKVLTWWKDLVDRGLALNLGRNGSDSQSAFAAGQVGMILASTASLRGILNSVGDKFEVGTGFLPRPANAGEGGVIVGGASLYMMNNRPEAEQKAAWEFVKYLVAPERQAVWQAETGYFPITNKAYDQEIVVNNMTEFPQFQTAVNQLHATQLNTATKGAVMGVFPEARQIVETAIEEALNGVKSPQNALDDAAAAITDALAQYNRTVKQ